MCLARVEVLHERRWDLVGCLSPQRLQVHALLMVYHEGYNTRGDASRCCTKATYYASNELAGEGGLEVGDQVGSIHLGSAEVER